MLTDSAQRALATDPTQSFIVQAPAGSGKTELLAQRFLRLLALVEKPEHIIAITFTRKAAHEMKERILASLKKASEKETAVSSAHQKQTLSYARAALQRDQQLHWQLLKQPQRLRIMTIDALCQMLSHAIPVLDKELPFAKITDAPQGFYLKAARNCIKDAMTHDALQPAIKILLTHLDNRQDVLIQLFTDLLRSRDQWLSVVLSAKQLSQEACEEALYHIEEHMLQRFIAAVPAAMQEELCALSQQAALIENDPVSPRYPLQHWTDFSELNRDIAIALAHLWLSKDNTLRKGFDHHIGFRKTDCPAQVYTELKQRSQSMALFLQQQADCCLLLVLLKNLPNPHYDDGQWQVLQALLLLLPFLAAHLHLIFKDNNVLDFAAVTQQAIHALGDEDNPTDLTLYMDHMIHHLLIDEFQDTSLQQMRLLELLVQGWQAEEGKTLFVVGDPMQSIYRFRLAEVGLFLKAKQDGIGGIMLRNLSLSCNFRSAQPIIDWINQQFQTIFPKQDDITSGAVQFHPSLPTQSASLHSFIQRWQCSDKKEEALALIDLVSEELARFPEDTLAILVRSRHQLTEIIPLLRERNIAFQGVEIDKLSGFAHLRDLWSLTQALLYPAHRLAWLALLRSPWCGLTLSDMVIIAETHPHQSILDRLSQLNDLKDLSPEGQQRAQFIYYVMQTALDTRYRAPLADWVHETAKQLWSDHIWTIQQKIDIEQFFQLLEKHEKYGQIADLALFTQEFEQLFAQSSTPARLQIMTIHKAKGLEFDSVILPGLGSRPPHPEQPLLRWLKMPGKHQKEYLLISPIHSTQENTSSLYRYLGDLEKEKTDYELQRLLYVATTRAKKRLYLLDCHLKETKGSLRGLLKQQIFEDWTGKNILADFTPDSNISNTLPSFLYRLPQRYYTEYKPYEPPASNQILFPEDIKWVSQYDAIAQELLQWMCQMHAKIDDPFPKAWIALRCKEAGFNQKQTEVIQNTLEQHMKKLLNHSMGQWICQEHPAEQTPCVVQVMRNKQTITYSIDRSFEQDGKHWLIQFKTGHNAIQALQNHRAQMNYYAQCIQAITHLPIHCGLYYLEDHEWIGWPFKIAHKKRPVMA